MTPAPDERAPPEGDDGAAVPATDESEDAEVDETDAEDASEGTGPSSPREQLMALLGHGDDAPADIDTFLTAQALFERGDNRRAAAELRTLLDRELSPELREVSERLMQRVRPDRVALIFLAVCVLGLVLIWILAIRAS